MLVRTTARRHLFRTPSHLTRPTARSLMDKRPEEDDNRDRDFPPHREPKDQDPQGAAAEASMKERETVEKCRARTSKGAPQNGTPGKERTMGMQDERGKVCLLSPSSFREDRGG